MHGGRPALHIGDHGLGTQQEVGVAVQDSSQQVHVDWPGWLPCGGDHRYVQRTSGRRFRGVQATQHERNPPVVVTCLHHGGVRRHLGTPGPGCSTSTGIDIGLGEDQQAGSLGLPSDQRPVVRIGGSGNHARGVDCYDHTIQPYAPPVTIGGDAVRLRHAAGLNHQSIRWAIRKHQVPQGQGEGVANGTADTAVGELHGGAVPGRHQLGIQVHGPHVVHDHSEAFAT